jgi:soluble lytic murein transglycosylase-like protein
VAVGQHVTAGQEIAKVGSIGYSTGSHLHFSVFLEATGTAIDPLAWLRAASVAIQSGANLSTEPSPGVLQWAPLIRSAEQAYNVPAALFAAVMTVESSGNPQSVSPAGAQGLMQIMPSQLTRLGVPKELWQDRRRTSMPARVIWRRR